MGILTDWLKFSRLELFVR